MPPVRTAARSHLSLWLSQVILVKVVIHSVYLCGAVCRRRVRARRPAGSAVGTRIYLVVEWAVGVVDRTGLVAQVEHVLLRLRADALLCADTDDGECMQ